MQLGFRIFHLKNTLCKKIIKFSDPSMCRFIQKSCLQNTSFSCSHGIVDPKNITTKEVYSILIEKKVKRPYTENMWQKKLCIQISKYEWENIYIYNLKSLRYKKFSEFKYKILLNILACGDRISRWNKNVSKYCIYCKCKEDISHMLYECSRIKSIWNIISNCMQLNISLKHIVLGILCENFVSENKNICIAIVSFTIYSNWYTTSINHGSYATLDIKKNITHQLSFYGEVYEKLLQGKQQGHFKRLVECVIFHLQN